MVDLAVAVMSGNLLTLSAFWGVNQLNKTEKETGDAADGPWLAFGAVALPAMFFFLVVAGDFSSHPTFDAITQATN